jgi:hypothetical protein
VDAAASLCGCKRNPELVMASWHGRLCKPGPGRANLGLGPRCRVIVDRNCVVEALVQM